MHFIPSRAFEGRPPLNVPLQSITGSVPVSMVPFIVLFADTRTFSQDAARRGEITYPTGSGSTNWDGSENADEPIEDDEVGK